MPKIFLTGFLICRTMEEADRAASLLPEHIRLTLAEPGCEKFEVVRSMSDPLRFAVSEIFATRADFDAHGARARASDWGRATPNIPRDFTITEA